MDAENNRNQRRDRKLRKRFKMIVSQSGKALAQVLMNKRRKPKK